MSKMQEMPERRMSPFFYGENEELLISELSDIRKGRNQKNEYVPRPSPLDDLFENTTLRKSLFLGIYHLLITVIIIYILNHCINNIMADRSVIDMKLFHKIKENTIPLIIAFCGSVLYSFIAFIIQKFVILTNMNIFAAKILAYGSQYTILVLPYYIRFHYEYFFYNF